MVLTKLNTRQQRFITRAMQRRGWSQLDLAKAAGIACATVGKMIKGKRVHPAKVLAVVNALLLDHDVFFGPVPSFAKIKTLRNENISEGEER